MPEDLKLLKEAKASTTPLVKWAVVIVRDEIESPTLSRPLPPRDRQILAEEARQNRGRPDDLISLLSESCIDRDVVMLIATFRDSHKTGRRENHAGIAVR